VRGTNFLSHLFGNVYLFLESLNGRNEEYSRQETVFDLKWQVHMCRRFEIFSVILLILIPTAAQAAKSDFQCYGTEYERTVEKFQSDKINEIKAGGFPKGVFQHTGGGPNGSHWNFSGMREGIFCVLSLPAKSVTIKSLRVSVGGGMVPVQMEREDVTETLSLSHFSIPFDTLSKAARKIRRQDLPLLYSDLPQEIAAYLKNRIWAKAVPPEIGSLVEVSASVQLNSGQTYSLTRMIHVNFGE
jgi:hypothetical protein